MAKREGGMIRTALFFTKPQMARLVTLSKNSGTPVAELIRRAVDMYLEHRKADINVRK
jgi:predicted DNA-binding protein